MPDTEQNTVKSAPEKKAAAEKMFVIDLTAVPSAPPREHEMMVDGVLKSFKFAAGQPISLPRELAVKFLKTPSFKLTDKEGNILDWQGVPKQPDELQAGERLRLTPHETVARLSELHDEALWLRASQLPGGEVIAVSADREKMIEFIVNSTIERRRKNTINEAEPDSFLPEADLDEAA